MPQGISLLLLWTFLSGLLALSIGGTVYVTITDTKKKDEQIILLQKNLELQKQAVLKKQQELLAITSIASSSTATSTVGTSTKKISGTKSTVPVSTTDKKSSTIKINSTVVVVTPKVITPVKQVVTTKTIPVTTPVVTIPKSQLNILDSLAQAVNNVVSDVTTPVTTPVTNPVSTPVPTLVTYTTTQAASHSVSTDCWITISSKIYNVTSYLSIHPGGRNVIITYCGKDATVGFQTKNGGGSHSSYAYSLLPTYYVGDIVAAVVPTNGVCGASSSQALSSAFSTSLCTAGTASSVSGVGPWTWSCTGVNGGTTSSCSASLAVSATPVPQTYIVNIDAAGNYTPASLDINASDSVVFVYTAPIGQEVVTRFIPTSVFGFTLNHDVTQTTKVFTIAGTWTYKAADHNGNTATIIVH